MHFTFIDGGLEGVSRCPVGQRAGKFDVNVVQNQWGVDQFETLRAPVECPPKRIHVIRSLIPE